MLRSPHGNAMASGSEREVSMRDVNLKRLLPKREMDSHLPTQPAYC